MSDLPSGFVVDSAGSELPPGFVVGEAPKKKFGLSDTWPAKLAKSVYNAVTLPGDVAQGNVLMTGEDGHTNPDVINRSAELASIASPMAPRTALAAIAPKALEAPTQEALASAASAGYDKARGLGVELAPRSVSNVGGKIGASLNEMGINGELAPKTFSILKKLEDPPEGAVATLANVETLRRSLGHAAKDFSNPTEQLAAGRAISHLDDYLAAIPDQDVIRGSASEASKVLSEARGNYAASKRSEQIAEALRNADLQAGSTHSGQNLDNATRQKFRQILTNDKAGAGYTGLEDAQLEKIVKGTALANTARGVGAMMGGGGGLGAIAAASAGAMATPHLMGAGAVTPLVGYGLKKFANKQTMKEVERLSEMTRSRSPLAQQLLANTARYSETGPSASKAALARALMTLPQE